MIVSWSRSASSADDSAAGVEERRGAEYSPAAAPERQPGLATVLPTGIWSLTLAACGILLITAAAVGPSLAEMVIERPLVIPSGRFARTLTAMRTAFDLHAPGSLAPWTSQILLIASAAVAWAVRGMRRHRRDDYNGRFRAWGWMAAFFLVAALVGQVPVGRIVAAFAADASGIVFGPGGLGWWVALTAITVAAVSLWAVLPLHERLGTALWLGIAAILWGISVGPTWALVAGHGSGRFAAVGQAAWAFAAAAGLIAMLVAARSVIREIRGEAAAPAERRVKKPALATTAVPDESVSGDEDTPESEDRGHAEQPVMFGDEAQTSELTDDSEFTDGSGAPASGRKLTKAERKRLKRMARLQQAG